MNKIVREHYPVENLPEDLRGNLPAGTAVTVQITNETEQDDDAPAPLSVNDAVALMTRMQEENSRKGRSVTWDEAVKRVRDLRDEWDD